MARLFRIGPEGEEDAGKSEKLLTDLGIAVRKNSGEFRTFDAIMKDINKGWSSFGNITQNNLAQVVGGTYHYSKLINLQENFGIATSATSTALNSQNSALNENAKRMEGIEGKMGVLKATIEKIWSSILKSDILKGFIDVLISLTGLVGNFNTILAITASVIGVWKGTAITAFFVGLGPSIMNSIKAMNLFQVISQAMIWREKGWYTTNEVLSLSFVTLKNSIKSLGASILATFTTNPIGWITLVITGILMIRSSMKQAQEEQKKAADEAIRKQGEEVESIKSINKYYLENKKNMEDNKEVKNQLIEMQKRLFTSFGKEAEGIDLVNGVYDEQIKKLDDLEKAKRSQQLSSLQMSIAPLMENKYATAKVTGGTDMSAVGNIFGISNKLYDVKTSGNKQNLKQYFEELKELEPQIAAFNKKAFINQTIIPQNNQEWANSLAKVQQKITELQPEYDKIIQTQELQKQVINETIVSVSKFNEVKSRMYDIASKKTVFSDVEQYQKDNQAIAELIKNSNGNVDELMINISKVNNMKLEDVKKEFKSLADGSYYAQQTAEELEKAMQKADTAFKKSIDSAQVLTDAMKELDEKGELSSKTLEGLIIDYPNLTKYLGDEVTLRKEIQKTLDEEVKNQRIAYNEKLLNSDKYFNMMIADNSELVAKVNSSYDIDVKNFGSAAIAKQRINSAILTSIVTDWSKVWGTQAQALGDLDLMVSGKEGPQATNISSFVSPEQLAKMKDAQKLLTVMEENAKKIADSIKFETIDTKDRKSESSGPADKNPESYKNEKDDLFEYKQILDDVTNSLEKNQTEQKKVTSFTKRVRLLKEEVELLKSKKQAVNNLAWEEGELARLERQKLEQQYNLQFDKNGVYNAKQYDTIVDSKVASINKMGSGDSRDDAVKDLENFKNFASKYIQLRTQFHKDLIAKENVETDISSKNNEIAKTEIDELFSVQDKRISGTIKSLETLKSVFEGVSDTNFDEKIRIISLEMKNQKSIIDEYTTQIDELGKAWWKAKEQGASPEELDRIHNNAEEKRTKVSEAQKGYADNSKTLVATQTDSLFYKSDSDKKKYDRQKKNVELQGKALDDNDYEGKEKNRQSMIDLTTAYLTKQTEELVKVNSVTDESILNSQDYKDKLDALKDGVGATTEELKGLFKAQSEDKVKIVNDVEKEISDIIKKGVAEEKKDLDEKLKNYNDYVDEKLKAFDRENATADYSKDLKVETDKKAEIQKKLSAISGDRSFEGVQKRKELEKEMKDQDLKISDMKINRSRELIKNNYTDQKDALTKETEVKKTAIDEQLSEENIANVTRKAMMAKTAEEFETAMKPVTDNLKNFYSKLEASGTKITTVQGLYKGFANTFGDGLKVLGASIQENFLKKLDAAKIAMEDLNKISGGKLSEVIGGNVNPVSETAKKAITTADKAIGTTIEKQDLQKDKPVYQRIENIKKDIGIYQRRFMEIDADIQAGKYETKEQLDAVHEIQNRYRDGANNLRVEALGIDYNLEGQNFQHYKRTSTAGIQETQENRVLGSYASGIENGAVTRNGLYQLHGSESQPEYVLNSGQMTNFIKNLATRFSPNFGSVPKTANISGSNGDVNLEINIGGNADASTVEALKQESTSILGQIKKALNKTGIYR